MKVYSSDRIFFAADHAEEEVLHQDLLNLHQLENIQYEGEEEDADSDSVASDYDDVQFIEDYKDHDWSSGWLEHNFDENKLKVNLVH